MRARDQVPGEMRERAGRSGGRPLAPTVRRAMETRLGHSFADVRVHSDASAAGEARALGARAFAIGRDVVFGARQFAPTTQAGQALLAHELAHVVQQRGTGEGDPARAEAEAAGAGSAVASGRSFVPMLRTGPQVALQEEGEEHPEVRSAPPASTMPQEEQLHVTHDRIAAATSAIASGVTELGKLKEAERPPVRDRIHGLERELANALADNVTLLTSRILELEQRAAAGEDLEAEVAPLRRELQSNQADLETLKGVFSPAKGEAFEETYRKKVAQLDCMGAAYAGVGTLTSPQQAAEVKRQVERKAAAVAKRKPGLDIDQFITVMNTANANKMAGPKQRAAWSRKHKRWTPTLESIVRAHVNAQVPGFYFFGLALAEGYHSILIGISTWDAARTLWCDQGGCTVVPGTLDAFARKEAESFGIPYGDWDTYIWQVLPPAAASLLAAPEGKP